MNNQEGNNNRNKNQSSSVRSSDSSSSGKPKSELPLRLKEIIGNESVAAFARRCGFGESLLRKYLDGASPSIDKITAIASAAGVTIDWLATGKGFKWLRDLSEAQESLKGRQKESESESTPLDDRERLKIAIEAVEEGLAIIRKKMPPDKKAELVLAAYDLISESENSHEKVVNLIKLSA